MGIVLKGFICGSGAVSPLIFFNPVQKNSLFLILYKQREFVVTILYRKEGLFIMKNSKKSWLAVILALSMVFMFGCTPTPTPPDDDNPTPPAPSEVDIDLSTLSISPRSSGDSGVAADQGFLITGEDAPKWKEEELRSVLQMEPQFAYSLEKQDDGWVLSPDEALERNSIYRFQAIGGDGKAVQSFAFQTESDLLVNSSYPQQDSDYVDPNSGIEISFNTTGISADDFKAHFSIQPAVSGEFQVNGYTAAFIPKEPLQPATYYHVAVSKGLKAPNGMELTEDYSFSFGTENNGRNQYYLHYSGRDYETYMPGDDIYFFCYTSNEAEQLDYQISAYRFPDYQAYVDDIAKRIDYPNVRWGEKQNYRSDTAGLQQVYQQTQKLTESRTSENFVVIPGEGLEPGFYFMSIQNEDASVYEQKYFQICSLSVYTESASGNSLVWVNDPETGKPLENMEILFRDVEGKAPDASGKTNADGIAKIKTGEIAHSYITIKKDGSPVYYTLDYVQEESEIPLSENYFLAIYTDREVYQPTDTIHFWGVVAPRSPSGKAPSSVAVALGDPDAPSSKVSVQVGGDGTFIGELPITALEKGYYRISILDENGKSYDSHYVHVYEFTKPAYIIDVSHSKPFYYANEPVDFGIKAKYFDGSPVSGGKLFVNAKGEGSVTLDETGSGTYSCYYQPDRGDEIPMWTPASIRYRVSSGDQRDVYMSVNGSVRIIRSRIGVQEECNDSVLTIRANYLDEAKLKADPSLGYDEAYTGMAADIPLRITVNKVTYTKVPLSTRYDPILKENVTVYHTNRTESVADVLQAQTVGGIARIPVDAYQQSEDVRYWYQIEFDGGVSGTVRDSYYPHQVWQWDGENYRYSFQSSYDRLSLKENDTFSLGLYQNGQKAANKGRILYNVYQRGILSSSFMEAGTNETALTFGAEYIPSIQVTGAYFDGRKVFTIDTLYARFDYTDRTLKIDISTDKENYRPGEEAAVTVKVSEPNASVCVGIVDESIFHVEPQDLDIAQQLYKSLYYPDVHQNASYVPYEEADMANPSTAGEMGGAGGGYNGYMREKFVDTALFQTVKADENGIASVKLDLPDNITSWRITAAAVTDDLKGGSNTGNTIVTQPFYLQTIVTDTYLTGDDVSVSAMGVGTEGSHGEEVQYTALLKSPDGTVIDTLEAEGTAGRQTPFNFGKRPAGEYILEVSAKSGEYTDALRQPFSVVSGVQTEPVFRDNVPFGEISSLESVRYPVRVTVYNTLLRPYLQTLTHLMYRSSDRIEELAASYEARKLYNLLLPEDERESVYKDQRLEEIQDWNSGGIRILPKSEADPAATAKMLVAAPDLVESSFMEQYFHTVLSDPAATQEQRIYAYFGLAAMGQPILRDIQRLASEDRPLSEKLLLGAAMALFGDVNGANRLLDSFSRARKEQDGLVWYEGASQEESLKNTANALLLVSLSKSGRDADAMAQWLVQQTEQQKLIDTPVSLELLAYLRSFEFDELPESKFTYMLDGELQEVSLDETGTKTLSFYKDTLEKADFKAVSGDIAASVRTTAYSSGLSTAGENLVQISKQYYPVYAENGFAAGQRVRVECTVTFSADAPDGSYAFADYIPSGMRYLPNQNGYRDSSGDKECFGYANNEGQKMNGYICLYREKDEPVEPLKEPAPVDVEEPITKETINDAEMNPNTNSTEPYDPQAMENGTSGGESRSYTLVYYVSNTLPGEFQTEKAVVSSEDYDIRVESAPGTVVIR